VTTRRCPSGLRAATRLTGPSLKRVNICKNPLAAMPLEVKIHDGETVPMSAGKDGLMFNGDAAKAAA
jgi:hypothetical protein